MLGNLRSCTVVALVMALFAAGCDVPVDPVSDDVAGPSYARSGESGNSHGKGKNKKEAKLRIIPGTDGDGVSASRVIGPNGGRIHIYGGVHNGGHTLIVPAGAVEARTEFVVTLTGAEEITVGLTATSVGSAVLNDVGSKGFGKDVLLDLSFEKATRGVDLNEIVVAFVDPAGGELEAVESHVFRARRFVRGHLQHFSGYALADRASLDLY